MNQKSSTFWKTKKGVTLYACIVLNILVLGFIAPPVIYYSKTLLTIFVTLLLLISLPVSISIAYDRNIRRQVLKYFVTFLMLSLLIGWPYLQLTALASTYIHGHNTVEQYKLTNYRGYGTGNSPCLQKITLKSVNSKHKVCTEDRLSHNLIFTNITESELMSSREDKAINIKVHINTSLGVSIVTKINKI